jgi:hypothetical protein
MQVAQAICDYIKSFKHNWSIQDIRSQFPNLNYVDFIIIGEPSKMQKVNQHVLSVLKEISKNGFTRIWIAIFETYKSLIANLDVKKRETIANPDSTDCIIDAARKLGFNVFEKILKCEIKEFQDRLIAAELKKVASFTEEFFKSINPGTQSSAEG